MRWNRIMRERSKKIICMQCLLVISSAIIMSIMHPHALPGGNYIH
jgi:hypothetical protein